jgi:hypothetical protein
MQIALDSATPPTAAQVALARLAGIRVWSGYISTAPFDGKPHFNLARPWSQAEFAIVKALPGIPIAFYSGWDDPAGVKALAAVWGVRPCLDVEGAIRGDGPWVDANLAASGGGLYGFASAFPGRRAAFAILADRSRTPPDPKTTWAPWHPRPAMPRGWQWWGTHNEFGVGVDRSWLDDWFGGSELTQAEFDALLAGNEPFQRLTWRVKALLDNTATTLEPGQPPEPNQLHAALEALKATPGGTAPSYQGTINLTPK